jgi:hypothetical protein
MTPTQNFQSDPCSNSDKPMGFHIDSTTEIGPLANIMRRTIFLDMSPDAQKSTESCGCPIVYLVNARYKIGDDRCETGVQSRG